MKVWTPPSNNDDQLVTPALWAFILLKSGIPLPPILDGHDKLVKYYKWLYIGNRPENQQLPGLTNAIGSSVAPKGIDLEYEPEGKMHVDNY